MTRRKTVNRTHRVARPKEPKTIQDARELILALVPNNHRVYISAHWHDERSSGRAWSSSGYSCSVYNATAKEIIDVESPTPAGLVAAVHRALQERYEQARATAAATSALATVIRRSAASDPAEDEFQDSIPRLSPRPLPLLTNGD